MLCFLPFEPSTKNIFCCLFCSVVQFIIRFSCNGTESVLVLKQQRNNKWIITCTTVRKKFYPHGYLHFPNCHLDILSSSYAYGKNHYYSYFTCYPLQWISFTLVEKKKITVLFRSKEFKWNMLWIPLKISFLSLTSLIHNKHTPAIVLL